MVLGPAVLGGHVVLGPRIRGDNFRGVTMGPSLRNFRSHSNFRKMMVLLRYVSQKWRELQSSSVEFL